MHAQRSSEQVEAAVLGLLLDERYDLWSVAEVEREVGDKVAVADAIRRLRGAGLVYLMHDDFFVKPTHSAVYFNRLNLP